MKSKFMKFSNKKSQAGISLIELFIYLAIAAAIIIAGLLLVPKLFAANDADQASSQLTRYIDAVQGLGAQNGSYSWLGTDGTSILNSAGKISSATPLNPWGGAITIQAASLYGSSADNGFSVTENDVPGSSCTQLAANFSDAVNTIDINGTLLSNNTTTNSGTTAISPASIATACANKTSTLTFTTH